MNIETHVRVFFVLSFLNLMALPVWIGIFLIFSIVFFSIVFYFRLKSKVSNSKMVYLKEKMEILWTALF